MWLRLFCGAKGQQVDETTATRIGTCHPEGAKDSQRHGLGGGGKQQPVHRRRTSRSAGKRWSHGNGMCVFEIHTYAQVILKQGKIFAKLQRLKPLEAICLSKAKENFQYSDFNGLSGLPKGRPLLLSL